MLAFPPCSSYMRCFTWDRTCFPSIALSRSSSLGARQNHLEISAPKPPLGQQNQTLLQWAQETPFLTHPPDASDTNMPWLRMTTSKKLMAAWNPSQENAHIHEA